MAVLKFICSEKATNFWEISTLLLTTVHTVKTKVEILQNFVAFSEYMNFNKGENISKGILGLSQKNNKIIVRQIENQSYPFDDQKGGTFRKTSQEGNRCYNLYNHKYLPNNSETIITIY